MYLPCLFMVSRLIFPTLINVPLYGCTTIYLFAHLLEDILVVLQIWQLQRCYKLSYAGFCVDTGFQLIWINATLPGYNGKGVVSFEGLCKVAV